MLFRAALAPLARSAGTRRMGGMTNVKKNFWVEEWNGKREITEKTFELDGKTVAKIFTWIVAFPFLIHAVVKSEFDHSKNNCINPETSKKSGGTA